MISRTLSGAGFFALSNMFSNFCIVDKIFNHLNNPYHGHNALRYAGLFPIPTNRDWIVRLTFQAALSFAFNWSHYNLKISVHFISEI